jgi:outer membrane protein OmpA-like peptidoglycan-associated protein
MNARALSGILLALGMVDLGVLNVLLAPRLAGAAIAAEAPHGKCVAQEAPARAPVEATDASANIWAASIGAAPTTRDAPPARALPDIAFAFDSTRLEHLGAIQDLRRLARELRDHPDRQLLLRGHSDPAGFPQQNIELSKRRAAAVKDYLVIRGAPADRISIEGVGPNEPADRLQTPAAWARDRRVEILWR